jgi:glyoxylase-like metal-dependent hydrolase (beta-lactamase superfamily II)
VVWSEETSECAIIDAGNSDTKENKILHDFIQENGLRPTLLLGTHAHIDHVFGNWFVKQHWDCPYLLHELDLEMLDRSKNMSSLWNLPYTESPLPDEFLHHGDFINIGNEKLEIRFVPGHAPGHVVFVNHKDRWVVGGDTLFRGSIGRTDLPGGDHALLLEKIQSELFNLPEDFIVFSGHGPETNIGFEKQNNPYFLNALWE